MNARSIPLYGWLTAEAISLLGTRVSMIAIPWLVLVTTGSAVQTGLVAAAELTPMVLFKASGGPLVDRVGARRMAIIADLCSMVAVGLIPLLHHVGRLTFPVLLALVAVGGALRGPGDAATEALTPVLVQRADVPMERATGLASAIERGSTMIGAAIAGGLVATVGAADAVALDAASFGVCAVVLGATTRRLRAVAVGDCGDHRTDQPDGAERLAERDAPATSYVQELREGWRYLSRDQVLMGLCVMVAVTNLLDLAWSAVLLPVWARQSGAGVGALGVLFSVWGGMSMVGSMVAAAYGPRLPGFATYVVAFLITGLPRFVLFALGVPLWAILVMCVVGGCASGFLNPVLGAVQFERIPPPLVGRVSALNSALCWSLMPLGGIFGGLLVGRFGLASSFVVVGVLYFAATMAPALLPRFREMDRRPEPARRMAAHVES